MKTENLFISNNNFRLIEVESEAPPKAAYKTRICMSQRHSDSVEDNCHSVRSVRRLSFSSGRGSSKMMINAVRVFVGNRNATEHVVAAVASYNLKVPKTIFNNSWANLLHCPSTTQDVGL